MEDFKRIHITYYNYQYKKGKFRILVCKDGEGQYKLPEEYLSKKVRFDFKNPEYFFIYDDGDIEVECCRCNNITKKKEEEWIDLKDIEKYSFKGTVGYSIFYKIYRNIFEAIKREGGKNPFKYSSSPQDSSFKKDIMRYEEYFDSILREKCRLEYIDYLTCLLNDKFDICIFDVTFEVDKDAIKRELETLENFKMERVKAENEPFQYKYETAEDTINKFVKIHPINWEKFDF